MHRVKQFASKWKSQLLRIGVILLLVGLSSTVLLSQVAFAQNTYVITDGDRVVVYSTYATDPADVLDEAGLELGKDDTYTTQESGGVSEIIISRIQMVTVVDESQTLKVGTYGETVESLLNRIGIEVGESVRVTQPLGANTYDGMEIHVFRQEIKTIEYTKSLDYETVYCYDSSLAPGESRVLVEGKPGTVSCVAKVTYENGQEVVREVLNEDVLTPPINSIVVCSVDRENKVQVGSGRPFTIGDPMPTITSATEQTEETTSGTTADTTGETTVDTTPDTTVDTIVDTEAPTTSAPQETVPSGGTITTASGEVLTFTKSYTMTATAYTCEGETGITASGTTARVGAVAVDPNVIPLGSVLYIVTDDGVYNYGVCVAEDTGGLIKGNRVDLYFDTVEDCYTFGCRSCTVYVLG